MGDINLNIDSRDVSVGIDSIIFNTKQDGSLSVSAPTYSRISLLAGNDEDNSRAEATIVQEDYNGPLHIETSSKQICLEGHTNVNGRLNIKDPVRITDQDTGEEYELAIYHGELKIYKVDV